MVTAAALGFGLAFSGQRVKAQPPAASAPAASAPAVSAPTASAPAAAPVPVPALTAAKGGESCIETAEAATRPKFTEKFPSRALSGHGVSLEVSITHGKGQSVLPSGFRLQREGPAVEALKRAGFALPDPEGSSAPTLETRPAGDQITTRVVLPFLVLPEKPGRQTLTLPAVPIALSRASGEVVTLCTSVHTLAVEDPTANTPNPKPKQNPPPRRQREEWTLLKYAVIGLLAALVLAALTAFLVGRWLKRPKKPAPPRKVRPPWDVAREALFDLRHAGLVAANRQAEHYERAANIIRQYLGDRFGFDGLECTTRETVLLIRESALDQATGILIRNFLVDADLVKFAKVSPSEEQCALVLQQAEDIVQKTLPTAPPQAAVQAPGLPNPGGQVPGNGGAP